MDNSGSDNPDLKNSEADETEDKDRKDFRRTLKDRRRNWMDHKYKGPQRRYHIRRLKKDRRDKDEPEDDLKNYIP